MPSNLDTALCHDFGLIDPVVTLITRGQAQNETYRIETPQGRWIAKHYSLYYSDRRRWVEFEAEFLQHLRSFGIPVAANIPTVDGDPFADLDSRPLVLYDWADGSVEWPAKPELARKLGNAIAHMHAVSDRMALSGGERLYEEDRLLRRPLELLRPFLTAQPDILTALEEHVDRLLAQLSKIPKTAPTFGPVHGDIHQGNCFFTNDGRLSIFDFSLSGVGFRAYDFTGFLWPMRDRTIEDRAIAACCNAFLDGYREVRPLLPEEEEAIPAFVWIRSFWETGDWIECGTGRDQPDDVRKSAQWLVENRR